MRAHTEDLLTIRDGQPIDAMRRERLAADPDNARELERLTQVAEHLRRLPMLEPPPNVWERIAAEADSGRSHRIRRAAGWTGAAVAAAAAVAMLLTALSRTEAPAADRMTTDTAPPAPEEPVPDSIDYTGLVEESARLERLLAQLEHGPSLMNAGTALTIAGLEDHIVLLDDQLTYAEARDVDPRYRQALWRERVDVMNALLQVRYAQAWPVSDAREAL